MSFHYSLWLLSRKDSPAQAIMQSISRLYFSRNDLLNKVCPNYFDLNLVIGASTYHINQYISVGYVPKGFSPEEWAFFKARERRENNNKKKHFRSRPMVDFQKDLEAGKGRHHSIPLGWNSKI